ncbi:MAG: hypothetical protein IPK27_17255 [Rhodanobacteraceae bacterium]|nr:hypothetical protein [Rhodanobacteraceae bacterium]
MNLNAKVVGFGKCGSRMCYDFFATSFGKPLSYELRTRQGNILVDYLQHRWSVAKYWTIDLFGTRAHPLDVEYSIVDSDGENEIVKFVAYAEENGKKESYAFNGDRLTLGQHGTGCDYGAVAEAITKEMLTRNNNQLASIFGNDATFRIWMTSIAGGTGSGSSLVILEQDRKRKRKNSTYHMVMGVLPAEPILVVNGDERSDPDRNEAINAGRFLVKWLASQTQAEKADALFLASNTTTKYINDQGVSDAFKPEALINAYCASVVFQIAEANSPDAKCSPDYDPVEMANRCTGCAVLVAKAFREIEESPDADQNRRAAKDLLSKAISNPTIVRRGSDEFLNGLSVPLRTKEINCLLDAIQKNDRIRASDRMPLPKEFQTAKTIVLLHGLSDNGNPGLRKGSDRRTSERNLLELRRSRLQV